MKEAKMAQLDAGDEYWGVSKEQWDAAERADWEALVGDPIELSRRLSNLQLPAVDDDGQSDAAC
jgi:hypothetical protein